MNEPLPSPAGVDPLLRNAFEPTSGTAEQWNEAYARLSDYFRAHRIHSRLHCLHLFQPAHKVLRIGLSVRLPFAFAGVALSFLTILALAQVSGRLLNKGGPPESVHLAPAHLAAGRYVADDSPDLWGWVIFPPGFRAPKLVGLARLRAWTLKPAQSDAQSP